MATIYEPANQAREIAEELIGIHHPHLAKARIIWLKTITGQSKARICNALLRHAFGKDSSGVTPDFVVVVTDVDWYRHAKKRPALIDTLLCSMVRQSNADTGKERWALAKPDVSLYLAVVRRHGLNTTEEQQVGKLIKDLPEQLALAMDQELTDDEQAESDDEDDDEEEDRLPGESDEDRSKRLTNAAINDWADGDDATRDRDWEDAIRPDISPEDVSRIRGSVEAAIK